VLYINVAGPINAWLVRHSPYLNLHYGSLWASTVLLCRKN